METSLIGAKFLLKERLMKTEQAKLRDFAKRLYSGVV
jgi:hypothetical protein